MATFSSVSTLDFKGTDINIQVKVQKENENENENHMNNFNAKDLFQTIYQPVSRF